MGVWLISIEVGLLFVTGLAGNIAAAQRRHPGKRMLRKHVLGLVPSLFLLLPPLYLAATMRWQFDARPDYIPHAATPLAMLLIGGLLIIRAGTRVHGGAYPAAAWPAGRLRLLFWALILVLVLTVIGVSNHTQHLAREARQPVWTDYQAILGPPPAPADNAAPLYLQAHAEIAAAFKAFDASQRNKPGTTQTGANGEIEPPLKAEDIVCRPDVPGASLDELVRTLDPAVAIIRKAADRPACRFRIYQAMPDYLSPDADLTMMRQAANVMAAHGVVAARRGDFATGVADVAAIYRIARHSTQTRPCLISSLVEVGVAELGDATLAGILPSARAPLLLPDGVPPSEQGVIDTFRKGLAADRPLQDAEVFIGLALGNFPGDPTGKGPRGAWWLGQLYGVLYLEHDLAASRKIAERAQTGLGNLSVKANPTDGIRGSLILNIAFLSDFDRLRETAQQSVATSRCAVVAIALTRYRLDHATYPAAIKDLVPQYLSEISLDPFDGAPLRYRLTGHAATIYSVGPDLKDDRGKVPSADTDRPTDTGLELLIQ